MKLDERGRAAGTTLRDRYTSHQDRPALLDDLVARSHRRSQLQAGLALAAAVLATVAAGFVVSGVGHDTSGAPPAGRPLDTPPTTVVGPCQQPVVHCGPGSQLSLDFAVPVTWSLSRGFQHEPSVTTDVAATIVYLAESYRSGTDHSAGVTVVEGARAVRDNRLATIDQTAPSDARGLAGWMAQRPFLDSTPVTPTRVDGRRAWTVEVRLRHPADVGSATCNGTMRCTPVLAADDQPGVVLGIFSQMVARYTFVGVPGAGTVVIWSWDFDGGKELAGNQALVDTITFGHR